jgi:hypothetical protein
MTKKNHYFQKLCQIKLSQSGFFLYPLDKGTTGARIGALKLRKGKKDAGLVEA